jgi:phage-related protein
MIERLPTARKPLVWIGSSLDDLSGFPDEVKQVMGFAIHLAQIGQKHSDAKPLRGNPAFRGAGVLEIVDRCGGDAYRAVYTVNFGGVVYVLHAFQKKSKKGIETPLQDIRRIKERLREAKLHYEEHFAPKRMKA